MIDGERRLQPVLGQPPLVHVDSGVVDEHVQPVVFLPHLRRERPHLFERRQVGGEVVESLAARSFADLGQRPLAALRVAPVQQDRRAQAREFQRGLPADAVGGAGDEDDSVFHCLGMCPVCVRVTRADPAWNADVGRPWCAGVTEFRLTGREREGRGGMRRSTVIGSEAAAGPAICSSIWRCASG